MLGTALKQGMRKSVMTGHTGFIVPTKDRERIEDLSIPKFDPDAAGAVVLYRPTNRIDGAYVIRTVLNA